MVGKLVIRLTRLINDSYGIDLTLHKDYGGWISPDFSRYDRDLELIINTSSSIAPTFGEIAKKRLIKSHRSHLHS